ncbi:sulfatase-like hydrolase/transferase [Paenibacillus sepulcri]|uniref:Sulfatase-like hydrolase/transferase n=1 Tax=Paenibacillus sepulcri TaxID=359917 RepID=A0ABS7BVW1_9BACL|nr:sulfatase-like hydrolase/transferase [Paenibacillus sepulcri]
MSTVMVWIILFIWHLSWNTALNKGQGNKLISVEQVVMSVIVGIILQTLSQWNLATSVIWVLAASLFYYINLIHIRFFGLIISGSQIKQFLFSRDMAKVNGAMLFQAAGRLVKTRDLLYMAAAAGMVTVLTVDMRESYAAVSWWKWSILNCLLVILIFLTLRDYMKLKKGMIDAHKYGVVLSYFFSWVQERLRRTEQERLLQDYLMDEQESNQESEADTEKDEMFGRFKGKNVILIQMESFQQFLIHHKVEEQEITPFLNRLARENIEFTDIFSQFSIGHTADAELAVLHSLYPLKKEVVNYKHYDKKFRGLPQIFREHGYQAKAYHGYKGDFYNRRTMMNTHGFEAFYSEEDYLITELASYWMSDFSFFEQSVEKIKKMKQPFFSFMISLTSHFPFKLEEKHWGLQLSSDIPEFLALYYQSVNYTDRALQYFYECLEREGLLENTVFAFYGDHEGVTLENLPDLYEHLGMQQSNFLKSSNQQRVAKVPFIIASSDPDTKISYSSNKTGSTLDVGQTLLHLLGLPQISYGFGTNMFTAPDDRVIPLSAYPIGSFATKDILCYAPTSGDYYKSVILDRNTEKIIIPISENRERFETSIKQLMKSEYVIVNNLHGDESQQYEVKSAKEIVSFSPNVERLMDALDEQAIVIPISRQQDGGYLNDPNFDLDSMIDLESYYRKVRNRNIRFFSTFDFEGNEKPVYFEDFNYRDSFAAKGYKVNFVQPVSLPEYLDSLPDHVLIVFSAKDEAASQFIPDFVSEMIDYGFHKLKNVHYRHSYLNIVYKNKGFISLCEEVSANPLEIYWENRTLVKGIMLPFDLKVTSKGALVGNSSEIMINQLSYSRNQRGLNMAVVDMTNGKVLEILRTDTCIMTNIDNHMYVATKEGLSQEVAP